MDSPSTESQHRDPPRNVGRPSEYTDEKATEICILIEDNKSIRYICDIEGMPASPTLFRWLREHEAFSKQYARAKEIQADMIYNDIIVIEQELRDNTIDSNTARVLIDSHKWRAGKMRPKVYGDQQRVVVDVETLEDKLRAIRAERVDTPVLVTGGAVRRVE